MDFRLCSLEASRLAYAGVEGALTEILVIASKIYTGEGVIKDGYVYVKDGIVDSVGEGPVPEDLTFAALILGGEGRVVAPGLALAADVAVYPVRFLRPSPDRKRELYIGLGLDASFASSLPAVYELHVHGVTTIFVEYETPELAVKLHEAVGGSYGVAVNSCWGSSPPEPVRGLLGSIVAGPCGGPPMLESPPVYTPALLERPWDSSEEVRKAAGMGAGVIKEGARAELAVFDFSRPPGMLLDKHDLDLNTLYKLGLKVESLIVGNEVLVDGGEHLYIVDKHFSEARRLAERIVRV